MNTSFVFRNHFSHDELQWLFNSCHGHLIFYTKNFFISPCTNSKNRNIAYQFSYSVIISSHLISFYISARGLRSTFLFSLYATFGLGPKIKCLKYPWFWMADYTCWSLTQCKSHKIGSFCHRWLFLFYYCQIKTPNNWFNKVLIKSSSYLIMLFLSCSHGPCLFVLCAVL